MIGKIGILTIMLNLIVITVVFSQGLVELKEKAENGDAATKLEVAKQYWKKIEQHYRESPDEFSLGIGAMEIEMFSLLNNLIEKDYQPALKFAQENNYFKNYKDPVPSMEDQFNDAVNELDSGRKYVKKLIKSTFHEKIWDYKSSPQEWKFKGAKPTLIYFYADWCSPCKTSSPILEEIAKEYQGKVDFYKIDADNERELVSLFGINSIPTFLYIPIEGEPKMSEGIGKSKEESKKMFIEIIDQFLLSNN